MSKYTTELRFICESLAGEVESQGYDRVQEIIEKARVKIFSFDYPIFDATYKQTLETKIIKHYYTDEISEETYGLWKLRLDATMNEIMPYYNQLYESELIEFDPLSTTEMTTEQTAVEDVATDGTAWNLFNDTPQGGISNIDNNTYLTNATKMTDDNKQNTVRDYFEKVVGRSGTSGASALNELRTTFLNVDIMIIDEINKLFFSLWA